MYLTNDDLSLWELAHRMADSDPCKRYWLGLPQSVKDNVRLLVNEVHHAHLSSSLFMEKWRPETDFPKQFFIRHHLEDIEDCVTGRRFPRKFLEFVWIDRWEFWRWCEQSDFKPPDFWFAVNYKWADVDDDLSTIEAPEEAALQSGDSEPQSPRRKLHADCREMAASIWRESPEMPIAQVARRIQEAGLGQHFKPKTVVTWIRSVAPSSVQGRPGRPKK